MTVNTLEITSGPYLGNGVTVEFDYEFRIQNNSQLSVYETDALGDMSLLVLGSHYTVTGVGLDAGGTVVRTSGALPSGHVWYIRSNYVENQLTEFSSQGAFLPEVHERQFDHLTFLIQQQTDLLSRTMRLSDRVAVDGSFDIPDNAASRAGKYAAFDGAGNLTLASGTGADAGLRTDLAGTGTGEGASLVANSIQMVSSASVASFIPPSNSRSLCITSDDGMGRVFTAAPEMNPGDYVSDSTQGKAGTIIAYGDGSKAWVSLTGMFGTINAMWFGCIGDGNVAGGSTDNQPFIDDAMVVVRKNLGKLFFPASNQDTSHTSYKHSGTIIYGANDVTLEGESEAVWLSYTGVGTGISVNASVSDPTRNRVGLRNLSLVSDTAAIVFDWTGASYGNFTGFTVQVKSVNGVCFHATGGTGLGPYFNAFSNCSFFGWSDRTQIGIRFAPDATGNLAPGPNANSFTNIRRMASLWRGFDIQAGHGNLVANAGFESIKDCAIAINNVVSAEDAGVATATTGLALQDASKSWSTVLGNPLNFTNDTVLLTSGPLAGQSRRILTNNANTLFISAPWSGDTTQTPSYQIAAGEAVTNKFVNIRQEGTASDNPDCVRLYPGANNNEFSQIEAGSLGTGLLLNDLAQDPSNVVNIGSRTTETIIESAPGPNRTINLIPRTSIAGGMRVGTKMIVESIWLVALNFPIVGSPEATLTVDHGGATPGTGDPSLAVTVSSFNAVVNFSSASAFTQSTKRITKDTVNNGIFATLTTNADVPVGAEFICHITYQFK